MSYSDLYGNSSVAVGMDSPVGTDGNIEADPDFDTSAGDFSLRSSSPCIDAGSPDLRDPDGTIRVGTRYSNAENIYGVAQNQRICFVSAGPDKRFGSLAPGFGGQDEVDPDTEDNIYSYTLETPE